MANRQRSNKNRLLCDHDILIWCQRPLGNLEFGNNNIPFFRLLETNIFVKHAQKRMRGERG